MDGAAGLGFNRCHFFRGRFVFGSRQYGNQNGTDGADGTDVEGAEYPVRNACCGGLVQPADLLEEVERYVGKGNAQTGKYGLHQKAGGLLVFGNCVGDEGAERLHRGIVTDIQQPKQQDGHPQCGNVRI